ncbi:IS256 family transposase, partial [Spiroplasma sp. AdecLV25b]|uniref:IS256 family transposase n=1 Tax=Spiroplasma sp. AdecLV25b TaxID=3027162 RepID=UPI0027E16131
MNKLLKNQSDDQIGANNYERNEARTDCRNGYYQRDLKSVNGILNLNVPRHCNKSFETEIFEKFKRSEQALLSTMMQMVIDGVSTRKVDNITRELCGINYSKSTVSNICKELTEVIGTWKNRDLSANSYPFIIIDGVHVKVRENNQVISKAVFIALGINDQGHRDILGMMVGDSESETTWSEFFSSLKERNLTGLDLVVSDAHKGLVKAVQKHFQGVQWQRCQAHFMRNILDKTPKKDREKVERDVNAIFNASSIKMARMILKEMKDNYSHLLDSALRILENVFDDALAILSFPLYYHKKLRTSNHIERLNREIRRREGVVTIFHGVDSVYR